MGYFDCHYNPNISSDLFSIKYYQVSCYLPCRATHSSYLEIETEKRISRFLWRQFERYLKYCLTKKYIDKWNFKNAVNFVIRNPGIFFLVYSKKFEF